MMVDAPIPRIDAAVETDRISETLRRYISSSAHKHGAVVAVSGGIDSAVTLALCARALGPERVVALLLPDRDSSRESARLGRSLAAELGLKALEKDITPVLDALGCYESLESAIQKVIPTYRGQWPFKLVRSDVVHSNLLTFYRVVVERPDGTTAEARLCHEGLAQILAAMNYKQRVRKAIEYHWADRENYAVVGTANLLEYDQGFFVRAGDALADIKPIAHLYKTHVCQLAEYLGIPDEIRLRPPTADTFSLAQSQEEFFFGVPLEVLDTCLYGWDHDWSLERVSEATDLEKAEVERVFADMERKRKKAEYLASEGVTVPQLEEWSAAIARS